MTAEMARAALDILPALILAGGGVAVIFFAMFATRAAQIWAGPLSVAILTVAGFVAGSSIRRPPGITFFGTFAADRTWLWGSLLILVVSVLTIALSMPWFRADHRQGEFYVMVIFSTLGAMLLAGAVDLMELVVAMLISSVTGYTMSSFHRRSRAATEAGIKYYLIGALANGALVYGVALLFGLSGGTSFRDLETGLSTADPYALVVGFVLVVIGVAFKVGAVPAHQWMPDVAEGAPAPVAAFLLVAGKVGAMIVLARLVVVLPDTLVGWRPVLAMLAALTMTLGNLAALWQDDVRRLLGWSSVSQTGYGLLAVVAIGRSDLALPALLFFLAAYALANLAAFGVVVHLRGLTERDAYAGLASRHPWAAAALLIAFLSFVGIPPLGGFAAKLLLMGAAIDAGYAWLAVLTVLNSALSLFYYARVIAPVYFGEGTESRALMGRLPGWATAAATAGVIGLGVVAQPLAAAWRSLRLLTG